MPALGLVMLLQPHTARAQKEGTAEQCEAIFNTQLAHFLTEITAITRRFCFSVKSAGVARFSGTGPAVGTRHFGGTYFKVKENKFCKTNSFSVPASAHPPPPSGTTSDGQGSGKVEEIPRPHRVPNNTGCGTIGPLSGPRWNNGPPSWAIQTKLPRPARAQPSHRRTYASSGSLGIPAKLIHHYPVPIEKGPTDRSPDRTRRTCPKRQHPVSVEWELRLIFPLGVAGTPPRGRVTLMQPCISLTLPYGYSTAMVTVVLGTPSWVILVISGGTLVGRCRAEFRRPTGRPRYLGGRGIYWC